MGLNQQLIEKATNFQVKQDLPEFRAGDTVKVSIKIKEGKKERIQIFEGFVLKRSGTGLSSTFTVRKMTGEFAVEKVFLLHSPIVSSIEVVKRGKVRQSRIYYMRNLAGKKARIKTIENK